MKREYAFDGAVAIVTLCALVTTTLVVHRELLRHRDADHTVRVVSDWRTFARAGHRIGPLNAPVTVVVFADFQCPFCGALERRLEAARKSYPRAVAVVYRYFPLPMHHQAVPAIRASECAADQGRFEAFHDALFADQDSVVAGSWEYIAHLADVHDLRLFDKCVAATGPIPALARDTLAARRLHVDATPTFLINETRLEGAQPLDTLELYIRRALQDGASPQR